MDAALGELAADLAADSARLTVRLDAVAANYRTLRRLAGPASVAGVVKADAYGLGMDGIARTLAGIGCDTFFVARLSEAVALRALLSSARIFVLDGAEPDSVPALIGHRLTPVLNSLAQVAAWDAAAGAARTRLDAAIHVDTGMNRLGLPGEELSLLAGEAKTRMAHIHPVLVMSHLACDDEPSHPLNARQLARFRQALAMLPPAPASLAASHGAMLGPDYHFDLVRPGIALYGGNPQKGSANLMRAAAVLTARVLQVRRIDRDESVGYGATFRAQGPSMLATIALGYADGIPRAASSRGEATIDGRRARIAGRVSMDLTVLDVSGLSVAPGDEAELLGETVTLEQAAEAAGTNEYEILTRLGRRIPRVYVGGATA